MGFHATSELSYQLPIGTYRPKSNKATSRRSDWPSRPSRPWSSKRLFHSSRSSRLCAWSYDSCQRPPALGSRTDRLARTTFGRSRFLLQEGRAWTGHLRNSIIVQNGLGDSFFIVVDFVNVYLFGQTSQLQTPSGLKRDTA